MLKDKTKDRIVVGKIKICRTSFQKAKGLMFSRRIKDEALLFPCKKEKRVSLHMFFVFFPIDVLFADKDKRVIEMKENFRPFSFYAPRKKSMYAVELPAGAIRKNSIEIGDELAF